MPGCVMRRWADMLFGGTSGAGWQMDFLVEVILFELLR